MTFSPCARKSCFCTLSDVQDSLRCQPTALFCCVVSAIWGSSFVQFLGNFTCPRLWSIKLYCEVVGCKGNLDHIYQAGWLWPGTNILHERKITWSFFQKCQRWCLWWQGSQSSLNLIVSEKSLCILSGFGTLIVTSPCRMKMNKHAPISGFEVCAKVDEYQPALDPNRIRVMQLSVW